MKDIIILAVTIIVLALATGYIIKAKKSGQKCIGCPHSKDCASKCSCSDKAV